MDMAYSEGKIAVITGAGSGIGRALAQQLNREGCRLLLCDISEEGLNETLNSLSDKSLAAQGRTLDISVKGDVQAWASDIAEQFGAIDILVNNAGVATGATVEDSKYEDIEWLMGINFWGVVYGTKEFLPLLRKSSQGHLVNISSIFGMMGVPTQSAYNAAKFAVRGYTEALRQEMAGSNVHVCCVHPGGIKTNIVRNARITDPNTSQKEREDGFDKMARTTPESAAAQIIGAIEKRKKRLLIGLDAKLMSLIIRLFPASYPRFVPGFGKIGNKENG
ncbi:MAG: short-subunit dehydrogenase [Halioglobus sp.]|jgi:short-subunit dehydrogenase